MKKFLKIALVVLLVLVVLAAIIFGVLLYKYKTSCIGTPAATEIALKDAGLEVTELIDLDCDFEHTPYSTWYEVELDTHGMEYKYSIDAVTGEILHSSTKPD